MVATPPGANNPITDATGRMLQVFRTWTQQVNRTVPLTGTGSPEGVVEAQILQSYMDDTGTAGSILYIKRDADILGDRSKGWILV